MSDTSAPLKAFDVAVACQRAVDDIIRVRQETLRKIVESKLGTMRYLGRTREQIAEALPDEEVVIIELIRPVAAKRLPVLLELSRLVLEDGDDLRMQVSVEDYVLLQPYFRRHS